MPRAIAISSMAWQTGAVSGPALAGILFAVMPSLPYALSSVLLAIATISIFRIRPVPPPPGNADTHPLRQIVEGMTYVGSDRFLLGCVTLDLFAVLLGGATALLPVYARDILTWHGQPVGSYGPGSCVRCPAWRSSRGPRPGAAPDRTRSRSQDAPRRRGLWHRHRSLWPFARFHPFARASRGARRRT
jgi:MFS family permease